LDAALYAAGGFGSPRCSSRSLLGNASAPGASAMASLTAVAVSGCALSACHRDGRLSGDALTLFRTPAWPGRKLGYCNEQPW